MPSRPLVLLVAVLACACPLAAQEIEREPHLLRVTSSSDGGVVLSLDSASISRAGDSVFVADAVYEFGRRSERKVESQAMDCAQNRLRGRTTAWFRGERPAHSDPPPPRPPEGWVPVPDDELLIFQAICQYLLGSFAASLPVTVEGKAMDDPPELANRADVARALSMNYPRRLRDAGRVGATLVRIRIGEDGRVDPADMRVLWSTWPEFADASLNVIRQMRFRPGRQDGRPVAVWTNLPVTFELATGRPLSEPADSSAGSPAPSPSSAPRP